MCTYMLKTMYIDTYVRAFAYLSRCPSLSCPLSFSLLYFSNSLSLMF